MAEPEWPLALRQQVIARVLGRVIAHKIGPTSLFLLTTTESERLDRMLGVGKEKGPADSRPLK